MAWRTRTGDGIPAPPGGVGGLSLWLDPTDNNFLTKNGDNLSEIRDKSGLGRDYNQTVAANQPLVKASGINSKQTIEYEATTEEWINAKADHFSAETDAHLYLVLKLQSDTPALGENGLLTWGSNSAADLYHLDNDYHIGVASTIRNFAAGAHDEDLTVDHVFEIRSESANWQFDISGVNQQTNGTNTVGFATTTQIGISAEADDHLDGEHGWLLQYDNILSAGDRTSVESAINTEWGITFS